MLEAFIATLFWGGYAAWLTLFAWIAWRGGLRLLLVLGAVMLLVFAITYALVEHESAAPNYNHSTDMALGLVTLFAAAVLILPLAVAAVAYPLGRLWAR